MFSETATQIFVTAKATDYPSTTFYLHYYEIPSIHNTAPSTNSVIVQGNEAYVNNTRQSRCGAAFSAPGDLSMTEPNRKCQRADEWDHYRNLTTKRIPQVEPFTEAQKYANVNQSTAQLENFWTPVTNMTLSTFKGVNNSGASLFADGKPVTDDGWKPVQKYWKRWWDIWNLHKKPILFLEVSSASFANGNFSSCRGSPEYQFGNLLLL